MVCPKMILRSMLRFWGGLQGLSQEVTVTESRAGREDE